MKPPDLKLLRIVHFEPPQYLRDSLRDEAMRTLSRVINGNIWAAAVAVYGPGVKPYVTQLARSVRESVR